MPVREQAQAGEQLRRTVALICVPIYQIAVKLHHPTASFFAPDHVHITPRQPVSSLSYQQIKHRIAEVLFAQLPALRHRTVVFRRHRRQRIGILQRLPEMPQHAVHVGRAFLQQVHAHNVMEHRAGHRILFLGSPPPESLHFPLQAVGRKARLHFGAHKERFHHLRRISFGSRLPVNQIYLPYRRFRQILLFKILHLLPHPVVSLCQKRQRQEAPQKRQRAYPSNRLHNLTFFCFQTIYAAFPGNPSAFGLKSRRMFRETPRTFL